MIVRGNLKKIVGFNACISNSPHRYGTNAPPIRPYLSFQQTAHDVIVEGMDFACSYTDAGSACAIEHQSTKAVVIKDCNVSGRLVRMAYRNAAPLGGTLGPCFIENAIGRYFDITERQNFYARQLNLEHEPPPVLPPEELERIPWVVNSGGGEFCALGVKTEGTGTLINTTNGSATEVIGGLLYPAYTAIPADLPAFQCTDSQFSLTIAESAYFANKRYTTWVRETRDGVTRDWRRADTSQQTLPPGCYQRGLSFGAVAPLYVGCPVRENLQALLVVGNPSPLWPIDAAANARLSSLGFQVTVVDDGASTSANADGKDVVLVSPSVDVNLLGTKFRDVAVPVVFSRGWAYPSMNMSVAHGNAYGGPYTQLNLVSNHPLAAGLSGTQTVLTSASPMGFGQPSAGGVSVASYPGQPTLWGIFGYEKDALMLNSQRAPERRVGFFLATTQNNLTPVGWQLFDAAVIWAARQ